MAKLVSAMPRNERLALEIGRQKKKKSVLEAQKFSEADTNAGAVSRHVVRCPLPAPAMSSASAPWLALVELVSFCRRTRSVSHTRKVTWSKPSARVSS